MIQENQFQDRMDRIERLIHELERTQDQEARARAQEMMQVVLDLHSFCLHRILETIGECEDGSKVVDLLARDPLVSSVLLLHELHPLSLEQRVRDALDKVRPYLRSHGGDVELLDVAHGIVRLRLAGSCNGCPSSTATLK